MSVDLNLIGQSVSGTPGTGTITLGAALPGLRALAATVDGITVNGQLLDVLLTDGTNQSVEIDCLYNSTAGTLARGTVESSTTGARLSLTSAAQVRVVAAASRSTAWQNNLGAVVVSGTPTAGQVPVATSATAATWQTPSGGGGGSYEVATFADLPAAASVTVGRVYTVLGPVCTGGRPGSQWYSDGTLWRPAGRQVLFYSATQIDIVAPPSGNQLFSSHLFPAGVFAGCNYVLPVMRTAKGASSTVDTLWAVRFGSAGNATDSTLINWQMTRSDRQAWTGAGFVAINNTTIMLQSSFTNTSFVLGAVGSGNLAAPSQSYTVPNMTTNQLYVSFWGANSAVSGPDISCIHRHIIVE